MGRLVCSEARLGSESGMRREIHFRAAKAGRIGGNEARCGNGALGGGTEVERGMEALVLPPLLHLLPRREVLVARGVHDLGIMGELGYRNYRGKCLVIIGLGGSWGP